MDKIVKLIEEDTMVSINELSNFSKKKLEEISEKKSIIKALNKEIREIEKEQIRIDGSIRYAYALLKTIKDEAFINTINDLPKKKEK